MNSSEPEINLCPYITEQAGTFRPSIRCRINRHFIQNIGLKDSHQSSLFNSWPAKHFLHIPIISGMSFNHGIISEDNFGTVSHLQTWVILNRQPLKYVGGIN